MSTQRQGLWGKRAAVIALQTLHFNLGNGKVPRPEPFAKVSWRLWTESTSALE